MKRTLRTLLTRGLFAVLIVGAALLTCSAKAEAGLLGDTINWQYYAYGGPYMGYGSPGSFVAGSTSSNFGVGIQSNFFAYFNVSANNSQIIFDYSTSYTGGSTWSPSGVSFNSGGLYIENGILLMDSANPFTSVSINSLTNMSGFSSSNITFNSSNIAINWAGLPFDSNTWVVLNVNTTSCTRTLDFPSWLRHSGSCTCRRFRNK